MRLIGNPNQLPSGAQTPAERHTKPRVCAVIPHRTEDPEGFIETRNYCKCGEPIIVSVAAIREMGKHVPGGLVGQQEVDELKARLKRAEDELESLQLDLVKVEEAEAVLEGVGS